MSLFFLYFARITYPFMRDILKEEIEMLEMIVFAIALVVANLVSTLILMKVAMSKRFLKKYLNTVNDIVNDTIGGFDEE